MLEVTGRFEFQKLMANEFHANGSEVFESSEPKKYLSRLHVKQVDLLKKVAKKNSLTAFITLGDGNFDSFMAADFCTGIIGRTSKKPPLPSASSDLSIRDDSIRPNASLALFYKKDSDDIELVFYTRFFVVSYQDSPQAREKCRKLDVETDLNKRKNLKKEIYKLFLQMPSVKGTSGETAFFPVNKIDSRNKYRFVISSVNIEKVGDNSWGYSTNIHSYVPYIVLQKFDGNKWYVPGWMYEIDKDGNKGKFSVIHGIVSTKGCWMFLRNYIWNWPNENVSDNFENLTYCFLALRQGDSRYSGQLNRYLTPVPGFTYGALFLRKFINHSYYDFIRLFSGMHYNCQKKYIELFPPRTYLIYNPPLGGPLNTTTRFYTSLIQTTNDFWKGERIWFVEGSLNGVKRKIVAYDGSTKVITVSPALPVIPPAITKFTLDNCWTPSPKPSWGPNAFGKVFGFNLSWADVYLFKREYRGSEIPFE